MKVYPVIHHQNDFQTLDQADLAFECGADGVFLISHNGNDYALANLAATIKAKYPDKDIGINYLFLGARQAFTHALSVGLDMIWTDNGGISSEGINSLGCDLARMIQRHPKIKVFVGVAFKYQEHEPDPCTAAMNAQLVGCIPTTSGDATGVAPDLEKVHRMQIASRLTLAIASGITPDNVDDYLPNTEYILVSTGVSKNFHEFDYELLRRLMSKVWSWNLSIADDDEICK